MKLLVCLVFIFAIIQNDCRAYTTESSVEDRSTNIYKQMEFSPWSWCAEILDTDPSTLPSPFEDFSVDAEDDKDYRRFIHCLWSKGGAVRRDGSVNAKGFYLLIEGFFEGSSEELEMINDMLQPCTKIKEDTAAQAALKVNRCFVRMLKRIASKKEDDDE